MRLSLLKMYIGVCVLTASFFSAPTTFAVLQSTNYQIGADSINFMGTETSVSTNYGIKDTGGEVATGDSTGVVYALKAGYRQMLGIITSSSGSSGSSNSDSGSVAIQGGGGLLSQSAFTIQSVTVGAGDTSLLFDVELNQLGKVVLVWGVSTLYDGGSITSNALQSSHIFKVQNLVPGTTYYFAIHAVNEISGQAGQVYQSATTLATPDTTAPANPNKLTLEQSLFGTKVMWQNPTDSDTELVKVVRSTTFYPINPDDGEVIYEGRAGQTLDTRAKSGKVYYYTVFTKDVSGNYSSGAIAKIYITKPGEVAPVSATDTFAVEVPPHPIDAMIDRLTLSDFLVTQHDMMSIGKDNTIFLDGGEQFKVAIDYRKLPEVLKTMMVTIKDKAKPDESFTFLLRVDQTKTYYEALVDKLNRGGNFAMVISILDHENRGMKQVSGDLVVSKPKPVSLFMRFINDPFRSIREVSWPWWIVLIVVGFMARRVFLASFASE